VEKKMTDNFYIYIIIALLPLTAIMSVSQVNPYHALVLRAILGAVAALVYVVLGAADVALTEALVGTMLAITLYVIAVRSSLVMRLGILRETTTKIDSDGQELITNLQKVLKKHYLRLELVEYNNLQDLTQGLVEQKIHGIWTKNNFMSSKNEFKNYLIIRVKRLFTIIETEMNLEATNVSYSNYSPITDKKPNQSISIKSSS
jgi:putative multicomponent Na+:H+ antiporter subunit B